MSAPSIYGEALESLLPLSSCHSFLCIGSGTGYFNTLVGETRGGAGANIGVEKKKELVELSRRLSPPHLGIHFLEGDAFLIDLDRSQCFDRIYVAAGAENVNKNLYSLLRPGGVLVGPFRTKDQLQELRRVERVGEQKFEVRVLKSVSFAPLIPPSSLSERLVISEPPWTQKRHRAGLYPPSFTNTVDVLMRGKGGPIASLPEDTMLQTMIPFMGSQWFEPELSEPKRRKGVYPVELRDNKVPLYWFHLRFLLDLS